MYVKKDIEFLSKFSRTMYRGFNGVDIQITLNGWYQNETVINESMNTYQSLPCQVIR